MVHVKKFEYIIVDLDGTLVEESARLEAQARAVSEKFGGSHKEMQAAVDAFFAANDRAVIEGGKEKNNIHLYMQWMGETLGVAVTKEESLVLAEAWKKAYEESFQAPILFDDALPFVNGLIDLGYETLIATGGGEEKKRKLMVEAGIDNFFSRVFAADEVGFQKQSLSFWKELLEKLAVTPDKLLMVGNQINDDIWRPGELGMTTVLVKRPDVLCKNLGPDDVRPNYEVSDLKDVLKLV